MDRNSCYYNVYFLIGVLKKALEKRLPKNRGVEDTIHMLILLLSYGSVFPSTQP
jgi:hypothetical protein